MCVDVATAGAFCQVFSLHRERLSSLENVPLCVLAVCEAAVKFIYSLNLKCVSRPKKCASLKQSGLLFL